MRGMIAGSQIGAYRIERVLGEGRMGVVYAGVHVHLGRRVAITQLHPELSGQPDFIERFFTWARAALRANNHPGICSIFDLGFHTDGSAYFVTELLEGDILARRLRAGPMLLATACTVAQQIASALAAAHAVGIVHRDLEPDNIILVRDDEASLGERAIVLDLGLAKLMGEPPRRDMLMGNPSYMSPEQFWSLDAVDHRTDVYAIGCTLFEMLTGRPPFVGASVAEMMFKHKLEDPPTIRGLRPDVSWELEALVLRCLAKKPGQRYQTMAELITALESCSPQAGSARIAALHALIASPSAPPMNGPPIMPLRPRTLPEREPPEWKVVDRERPERELPERVHIELRPVPRDPAAPKFTRSTIWAGVQLTFFLCVPVMAFGVFVANLDRIENFPPIVAWWLLPTILGIAALGLLGRSWTWPAHAARELRLSFVRGIVLTMDLGATHRRNSMHAAAISDSDAIQSDWDAIASDFASSVREISLTPNISSLTRNGERV